MASSADPPSPPPPKPYTSSLVPALPVPTHGPSGSFAILATTFIPHATPEQVLSVIRDTGTWKEWNSLTPIYTVKPTPLASSSSSSSNPPRRSSRDAAAGKEEEGWLQLGAAGTMDVFMNGDGLVPGATRSRQQDVEITFLAPLSSSSSATFSSTLNPDAERGFRIAWKATGYAHWQLHSERVTELVEAEVEGVKGTSYVCWETFGGVLGKVVRWVVGGQLVERFGEYAGGLRGFCVERFGREGG